MINDIDMRYNYLANIACLYKVAAHIGAAHIAVAHILGQEKWTPNCVNSKFGADLRRHLLERSLVSLIWLTA